MTKTTSLLSHEKIKSHLEHLAHGWKVVDNHHLEKTFLFQDFRHALNFTNLVGIVAEDENHHPDIFLTWGKVTLTIWTHSVNGLTEKDFTLAAKAESQFPKSCQEAQF